MISDETLQLTETSSRPISVAFSRVTIIIFVRSENDGYEYCCFAPISYRSGAEKIEKRFLIPF